MAEGKVDKNKRESFLSISHCRILYYEFSLMCDDGGLLGQIARGVYPSPGGGIGMAMLTRGGATGSSPTI